MWPSVGENVIYDRKVYRVQDRDNINRCCKIGLVDKDGLVWNQYWVPICDLRSVQDVNFIGGVDVHYRTT